MADMVFKSNFICMRLFVWQLTVTGAMWVICMTTAKVMADNWNICNKKNPIKFPRKKVSIEYISILGPCMLLTGLPFPVLKMYKT